VLAQHYAQIRLLHICCVAFSGTLFTLRGILRIGNIGWANHQALRFLSYGVDTLLLAAAIALTRVLHQYPFVNGWLTAKLLLLLLYIALGIITLRHARTSAGRSLALLAALATFAYIIGVALAHDPAGWFALLQR
jgi:uncharacterized membrane protein SirB2